MTPGKRRLREIQTGGDARARESLELDVGESIQLGQLLEAFADSGVIGVDDVDKMVGSVAGNPDAIGKVMEDLQGLTTSTD